MTRKTADDALNCPAGWGEQDLAPHFMVVPFSRPDQPSHFCPQEEIAYFVRQVQQHLFKMTGAPPAAAQPDLECIPACDLHTRVKEGRVTSTVLLQMQAFSDQLPVSRV